MSVSPILSKFGYFWQYIKFGWGEPQATLKYHCLIEAREAWRMNMATEGRDLRKYAR